VRLTTATSTTATIITTTATATCTAAQQQQAVVLSLLMQLSFIKHARLTWTLTPTQHMQLGPSTRLPAVWAFKGLLPSLLRLTARTTQLNATTWP
jgi:hypothetical protein